MKVVAKKLGRECAFGLADHDEKGNPVIVIDPRQTPRERLDTLLHEALHHLEPEWSEGKVSATARKLSAVVWRDNWRRIEK